MNADHEQHGDRVVEARLALERAGELAPQRRAAQQREGRGAVGRGDDRAEQQALERGQVEQPDAAMPVIAAVANVPTRAS